VSSEARAISLVGALGFARARELVALVGGGGKSSLMFALANSLPGRVVMTTTTRIFAAQMGRADEVCTLTDGAWEERLDRFDSSLLLVGRVEGDRAVGVPAQMPTELLAHPRVDWVVVEADGSRMLPVKAPAAHEPVIPHETGVLVLVVGIDALSGPIREVAHRPERVSAITGLGVEETLTPDALAALLTSPRGGLKDVPQAARVVLLINKVQSSSELQAAHQIARCALREPRVDRVVLGALRSHPTSNWEVALR